MARITNQSLAANVWTGLTGCMALGASAAPRASGVGAGPDRLRTPTSAMQHSSGRALLDMPRAAVPACTPALCFNATRCAQSQSIYVYPQAHPRLDHEDHGSPYYGFLPREPETQDPLYTRNPDEACLFAVYVWSVEHDYAELPTLPHWNGGRNHILIDFTDPAFSPGAPGDVIGEAVLAKSYLSRDLLRPGYDLSVPLLKLSRTEANVRTIAERGLLHTDARKHFLTFKGSTYREGTAGSYRWNLQRIASVDADVTIRLQCFKMHGWHLQEAYRHRCNTMDEQYAQADYADLANTTFALVPGGRQPASYRLTEAIAAASIPVFINPDVDWVKPYAHAVDWDSLSLTFRPGEEAQILPTLRRLDSNVIARMRQGVRQLYLSHFGNPAHMGRHLYRNALEQLMLRQHHHSSHGPSSAK